MAQRIINGEHYDLVVAVNSEGNDIGAGGGTGDTSSLAQEETLAEVRDRLPTALVNGRIPVDVASLTVTVGNTQLEIVNDVGNPIPVNGTVSVGNFPSSTEISNDAGNPIPVSGTVAISNSAIAVSNFPTSTEIANDAGNPIPVSGTVAFSNTSINVGNFPATQAVSGTTTANQGTAAAIASGWPVKITDGTNVLGTPANPISTQAIAATDSGLTTIDTDPEALATDPTANTSGTATTSYPATFLLRWLTRLTQNIANRLPTSTGAKTSALSFPVALSTDGLFATNFGAQADAAATTDAGSFSLISLVKRLLGKFTVGAQTVASSLSVAIASDQTDGAGRINVATRYTQQLGTAFSSAFYSAVAGFRASDPTSPPTYTAGYQTPTIDLNGAVLANVRSLIASRDSVAIVPVSEAAVATVSVTSTSTTYVRSTTIDLTGYNTITILPNVTANAGTTGYYKISWSEDAGANWFDETSDTLGASGTPSAGEKLVTQDVVVRQFASGSTGFKVTSACTLTKRARYLSISQKSDVAVTVTTAYNYQRF